MATGKHSLQVIDLTHLVTNDMPVFPGSEPPEVAQIASVDSSGYNEKQLQLSTHTGTHIDCPLHLLPGGLNTSTLPAGKFVGQGTVIDCRNLPEPVITASWLKLHEAQISRADFVILHTGWSRFWGSEAYYAGFPIPDAAGARYLADFALKGLGIDAISFDTIDSDELPVHNVFLSKGLVLVENLTGLEALPRDGFLFCCLPLKIKNGDGSPVRAVALINEQSAPVSP